MCNIHIRLILYQYKCYRIAGWWFQFFKIIFSPIWGRFPFSLIFFNWVETTNQIVAASCRAFRIERLQLHDVDVIWEGGVTSCLADPKKEYSGLRFLSFWANFGRMYDVITLRLMLLIS